MTTAQLDRTSNASGKSRTEQQFSIAIDDEGRQITIRILCPSLRAEGLSLETWASSQVLARQIQRQIIRFPHDAVTLSSHSTVPVLELGAGTGLVGLSAACIWKKPVVLTDLTPIVPGLAANITVNEDLLQVQDAGLMRAGTLDWNSPSKLHIEVSSGKKLENHMVVPSSNKAHVILAADTVYSEEHPALMTKVVLEWLSKHEDARFIITYAMRVAYLEEIRELWRMLEEGGLESVEEGTERASQDIFDDECLCEWSVWRWQQVATDSVGRA